MRWRAQFLQRFRRRKLYRNDSLKKTQTTANQDTMARKTFRVFLLPRCEIRNAGMRQMHGYSVE